MSRVLGEELTMSSKRRLSKQYQNKRNRQHLESRQTYLEKRELFYRKMDDEQLDKEWAARDENSIEPDEVRLLRSLIREKKGIESTFGTGIRVCGSCGEVGDNCTCGRSWF